MNDNKLIERQKKFNERSNTNNTHDNLLRRREEYNLTLRKQKLFDKIMEKRIRNYNFPCDVKEYALCIDVSKLDLSKEFIEDFELQSDKIVILSNLMSDKQYNTEFISNIKYLKFNLHKLRVCLAEKEQPLTEIQINCVKNSIYPRLLQIILAKLNYQNNEELQDNLTLINEACWCVINLTNDNSYFCNQLIQIQNLELLNKLLTDCIDLYRSKNFNTLTLINSIIWIFGNLLGDSNDSNVIVRNTTNIDKIILDILTYDFIGEPDYMYLSNDISKNTIWTILFAIRNFMLYVPPNIRHLYSSLLINVIQILKLCTIKFDSEIFSICLEALNVFSCNSDLIKIFLDNEIMPILLNSFNLLGGKSEYEDLKNILRIISELLIGSNQQVTHIMSYPIFDKFYTLLDQINIRNTSMIVEDDGNKEIDGPIAKSICLAISNLCASSQELIESIIFNSNLVSIIQSIYDKFDNKIKYEILHIYFNSFYCGQNNVKAEVIRLNLHKCFLEMLIQNVELTNPSFSITMICLRGIKEFLDFGDKYSTKINFIKKEFEDEGLVEHLELLQYHLDMDIYDLAHETLLKYWGEQEVLYEDYESFISG
jgi:hypothetical protein